MENDNKDGDGWHEELPACGHELHDPGQVHYCKYIGVDALMRNTRPNAGTEDERDFVNVEEHTFVIVHQSCELFFSNAFFLLGVAIGELQARRIEDATHRVRQVCAAIEAARNACAPLLHLRTFMTEFRDQLTPASGLESPNIRRVELRAGLRADTPYFVERSEVDGRLVEETVTYKEFLNQHSGPGAEDPKTRLWTEEMEELTGAPSLYSVFLSELGAEQGFEDASDALNRIFEAFYDDRRGAPVHQMTWMVGAKWARFIDALIELEEVLLAWRGFHRTVAKGQIGEAEKGSGNTQGVPYLSSVITTIRFFPAIDECRRNYRLKRLLLSSQAWED